MLRLMGELQQKYTNERDGLIRDIGIINDLLKKIREKRLHYEQMQIEEIIKRVSCEELLIQELEQVRNMKSELTRAYEDVLVSTDCCLRNWKLISVLLRIASKHG